MCTSSSKCTFCSRQAGLSLTPLPHSVTYSYFQASAHAVSLELKDISLPLADEILRLSTVVPKLCCTLESPGESLKNINAWLPFLDLWFNCYGVWPPGHQHFYRLPRGFWCVAKFVNHWYKWQMLLKFNILLSHSCLFLTDENPHSWHHQSWAPLPALCPHIYVEHASTLSVITLYQNYLLASLSPY